MTLIHSIPQQTSKFNDLAFAIKQDPSIASLILHLEKNKRAAVQSMVVYLLVYNVVMLLII